MKISSIISQRIYLHYPSYKIVYEWENIISKELDIPIIKETKLQKYFRRVFEKCGLQFLYHYFLPQKSLSLRFLMTATTEKLCGFNKNTIPVIIDFWLEKKDLSNFAMAFKKCPLVLVTNKEVYNFLKDNSCPLKIAHWPLSYPDIYAISEDSFFEKKYEFCLFGRPNPFFIRLLEEYSKKHPDFEYIISKGTERNRTFYTNKGTFVSRDTGRESYMNMIKSTKISCYTTPGIDESKKETKKFNQVTPRLFELLCNGCMVIGHYPKAADTDWYKLSDIIPNVNNYDEFEDVLNRFRSESFPLMKVVNYMKKHYTSARCEMLLSILSNN